jgi:hypothetical protein
VGDAEYGQWNRQWQCDVDGEREPFQRDEPQCDGDGGGSGRLGNAGRGFGHIHGDADELECAGRWRHAERDGDGVAE